MSFLFNLKGDVSRKSYVSYLLWAFLTTSVVCIFLAVYFTLIVAVVATYGMSNVVSIGLTVLVVLTALYFLLLTISEYVVTAKRLKNANKPRGLVFLGFIGLLIIPVVMGIFCK